MEQQEYVATFQGSAKEVIQRLYELLYFYWELQYKSNPEYAQSNENIKPEDIAYRYTQTTIQKHGKDYDLIIEELSNRLNQGGFPVTWFKAFDTYVLQIGYTEINEKLNFNEKV